jgi:hypothetical protein
VPWGGCAVSKGNEQAARFETLRILWGSIVRLHLRTVWLRGELCLHRGFGDGAEESAGGDGGWIKLGAQAAKPAAMLAVELKGTGLLTSMVLSLSFRPRS